MKQKKTKRKTIGMNEKKPYNLKLTTNKITNLITKAQLTFNTSNPSLLIIIQSLHHRLGYYTKKLFFFALSFCSHSQKSLLIIIILKK